MLEDNTVKMFYYSAKLLVAKLQGCPVDIKKSYMNDLYDISMNSGLFSDKGSKNYHVYYAFLKAYHAIVRHNEYYAKYNRRDAVLEKALKDWYATINQKQDLLFLTAKSVKQK